MPLILLILSMMQTTESRASKTDEFFAGPNIQFESFKLGAPFSKNYSGFSYGMIAGKDWDLGTHFGLKTYLGVNSGMLTNNNVSTDTLSMISPILGVGLNIFSVSLVASALYHSYSNGSSRDQSIGLQGEALWTYRINPLFSIQLGVLAGETLCYGSVGVDEAIVFRFLLNSKAFNF